MGLKRAKRNRWILGVCGGIGRTYGVSPNVVRLITVLLAIFIPGPNILVLIAYVLAGIFLPETDEY